MASSWRVVAAILLSRPLSSRDLTASLTGILGGHYSQDDVRELVSYASDRGVRVVPEFDVPGHSRGLLPELPVPTTSPT